MFKNGEGSSQTPQSLGNSTNATSHIRQNAYVKITEQPAPKALRFRYECEGRSAGSIPGVHSTPENKTFPSIQVVGYRGKAVVVVSCVTKDPPYKPHPHNLVGKDGCQKGVCTVAINEDTMNVTFSNLGIQCVKKKDIEDALRIRQDIKVDPYKTGFNHRDQPSSIDLNSVRLCFQVFVIHQEEYVALPPVVSDPIFDKKAMSDLVICKLSHCSCSVAGGQEMILLCEKVAKEDIQVRFYEEKDAQVVWEAFGDFQHTNVHKQVAISFRTPRYRTLEVDQIIKAFIQLKRPSDGATSDPLPFDYVPLDSVLKHKRPKIGNKDMLYKRTQEHNMSRNPQQTLNKPDGRQNVGFLNIPVADPIKKEPRDLSPGNQFMFPGTYRNPQTTPSPQPMSPATPGTPAYQVPNVVPAFASQPPHVQTPNYEMEFAGNYPSHFHSPGTFPPPSQQQPLQPTPQWNMLSQAKPPGQLNNLSLLTPAPQAAEAVPATYNGDSATNLSNLLMDMDSQQLTQLNSAELSGLSLSLLDGHFPASASEAAAQVKQEAVARMDAEQDNMTDSFTKLTTATLNEITNLGNMYNRNNN